MPFQTVISDDKQYRYSLVREVNVLGLGACLFGMLNPSKADATINDPTIIRDIGFARAWGFRYLWVVNLHGLRLTDPNELLKATDSVGPENDTYIMEMAEQADLFVCAWGAHQMVKERGVVVRQMLKTAGIKLHHLGLTKHGFPKHPLYLSKNTQPQEWI